MQASYEDFQKLDIRVGEIKSVEDFPEAKKPAFKLRIDFGHEVGEKVSSAQLTANYSKEDLIGRKVLGVVNFPSRQVGPFTSEVLTLGVPDRDHECILLQPSLEDAVVGGRVY